MQRESKVSCSKNQDSLPGTCKQAYMLRVVKSMHKYLRGKVWCILCVVKAVQNKFYLEKLYVEDYIALTLKQQ